MDFDSYWTGDALKQVDKIYTDDVSQMEYYRSVGYFKETPKVVGDLGQLLNNEISNRENESERIIAMNLGLALDDMATAPLVYQKALEMNLGTQLEL